MSRCTTVPRAAAPAALAAIVAFLLAACGMMPRTQPRPNVPPPAGALTRHVIVVSIDGLGRDAIALTGAETLTRLAEEGAFAVNARTILPSKTLPSHTSMLTGVGVEKHGVTWNTDQTDRLGIVAVPTMLELARAAGYETAMFVGKRKLKHLIRPNSLDHTFYPRTDVILMANQVAEAAVRYLQFEQPNLTFIHLPDPDLAGHMFGWNELTYRQGVRQADAAVEYIWKAARRSFGDDFVLIVTADHGGAGHNHGSDADTDVRIPWIAWGDSVVEGPVTEPVRTYDTAATALWLLGVTVPLEWDGKPVRDAFAPKIRGAPGVARSSIPADSLQKAVPVRIP